MLIKEECDSVHKYQIPSFSSNKSTSQTLKATGKQTLSNPAGKSITRESLSRKWSANPCGTISSVHTDLATATETINGRSCPAQPKKECIGRRLIQLYHEAGVPVSCYEAAQDRLLRRMTTVHSVRKVMHQFILKRYAYTHIPRNCSQWLFLNGRGWGSSSFSLNSLLLSLNANAMQM